MLDNLVQLVSTVLLHSLWQGAVIGLLYAMAMLYLQGFSPRARYACAVIALAAFGLSPFVTALVVTKAGAGWLTLPGNAALAVPAALESTSWAQTLAPIIVVLWLSGVTALAIRLMWNWHRAERLTYLGCHPMAPEWEQRLRKLARQIGVSRPVTLVESVVVSVPTVIGWLKPVILIPSSALLGLSQRQLELVIAHELAHIARYDYMVNYFLLAIETVFFYHPVVYLIGHGIRDERELCCDDLVVSRCGGRYEYVTALSDLETLRSQHLLSEPLSNLAATGGNLLHRVHRIVKGSAPATNGLYITSIAAALTVLIGGTLVFNPQPVSAPAAASLTAYELIELPKAPRVRPIETVVRAPSLARAGTQLRSVALIGSPPSTLRAQAESDDNLWLRSVRDGLRRAPIERPNVTLASLVPTAVSASSDANYEPERAGPTHAMISELDLESPMIESLSDLRRDASQALAVGKSPYTIVAPDPDESDYIVSELGSDILREEGGALIKRIEPRYPSRARIRGYTDTVQIEFSVTDAGKVSDIVVVSSHSRASFERAVVQAVRKWRYEPLIRDGVAVERRLVETFAFRLSSRPDETMRSIGCKRENNRFTCNTPGLSRIL
ncbi:MAG: TonB family protein [Gammaproteobacteria bacterium]